MPNAMPELRVYVSVRMPSTRWMGSRNASRADAQCFVHWSRPTQAAATPRRRKGERFIGRPPAASSLLFLLRPAGPLLPLDVVLLLDRVAGPRQRLETRARDRLARRFADAVDAVVDAAQRVVDLAQQAALLGRDVERDLALHGVRAR